MENQTGKENRMGLEYQAKRDLGLQSMGHGELGNVFKWHVRAEHRELLCENCHNSPGFPEWVQWGSLVLSCYFVLGTVLDPEMLRWTGTVPVFKEFVVHVLGPQQFLLSKEELLPTVPAYSVLFLIPLPCMFCLWFCKCLPLGSRRIYWNLWASLSPQGRFEYF